LKVNRNWIVVYPSAAFSSIHSLSLSTAAKGHQDHPPFRSPPFFITHPMPDIG
jgi:hypothetical protein